MNENVDCCVSGQMYHLTCHFLPLCSSLTLCLSLSLCVTHAPLWFFFIFVVTHLSVFWQAKQASPPAAPGSLNQTGLAWLELIGGQSRQQEGSLSGGATVGNVENGAGEKRAEKQEAYKD